MAQASISAGRWMSQARLCPKFNHAFLNGFACLLGNQRATNLIIITLSWKVRFGLREQSEKRAQTETLCAMLAAMLVPMAWQPDLKFNI